MKTSFSLDTQIMLINAVRDTHALWISPSALQTPPQHQRAQVLRLTFICALFLASFFATTAWAGSDTTFTTIVEWVVGMLSGSGGLLITVLALAVAAVSMLSGQLAMLGISVGIAIVAVYGPTALKGWFTMAF